MHHSKKRGPVTWYLETSELGSRILKAADLDGEPNIEIYSSPMTQRVVHYNLHGFQERMEYRALQICFGVTVVKTVSLMRDVMGTIMSFGSVIVVTKALPIARK